MSCNEAMPSGTSTALVWCQCTSCKQFKLKQDHQTANKHWKAEVYEKARQRHVGHSNSNGVGTGILLKSAKPTESSVSGHEPFMTQEKNQDQDHALDDLCPAEWDVVDNEFDNAGSLDHGKNKDLFSSESEDEWNELGDSDGESSPSSSDGDEEDSDAGEDITGDPHFIPQVSLFDPSQPGNTFASEQDFNFCQLPCSCFDALMLQGYSLILESAWHRILCVDDEPEDPFPGLNGFAQTLSTVEKHLGVLTEGFITYLFPDCTDRYDAFGDLNKPMKDVINGWAWQTIQAGLERCQTGKWEVKDVDMNIDWFQAVKGPHEPTLEQLNNVLIPLIHDLKNLYLGALQFHQNIKAASHPPLDLFFPVCDKLQPELFHTQLAMDISDLPASWKMSGLQLYTSIFFMCPDCPATFYSLTDPASFDPKNEENAKEISWRRGVRHLIAGLVKHTVKSTLYNNRMFMTDALTKMDQFFARLIWPPSVSHLSPKISHGAGSVKADQWKTMITVFFVAVFVAWEVDGKIPDTDAPLPAANTKIFKNPDTPDEELPTAGDALMDCLRWQSRYYCLMRSALWKSNVDVALFIELFKRGLAQFFRFGPCPVFGAYPYEHNHCTLIQFNKNGHSGGRTSEHQGTLQMYLDRMEAADNPDHIDFPRISNDTELWQFLEAMQNFGDKDYVANLAVVWCFQTDEFTTALQFPWYLWAVDLGIAIWSADQLGHLEVIKMKHLSGHFVLVPIDIHDQGVWVTITYENVSSD
ncbi:hypothetical protein ARMGADRAFT_1029884 [Armillaria gallica]|uniref:Uncharacterized protein n=1 Tax=Armillaria gallica TaxID=47427 RepID=A0A2H3DFQ1_ARMGA|nr:hypothetical protein ARMGADRAFT_1029884 [Armillaria gallica]